MAIEGINVKDGARGKSIADYWPLIALVLVSGLVAAALTFSGGGIMGWNGESFMHFYMGFFLVAFALLKLFDLAGFSSGFAMYDLLARRVRAWGFIYPFVELALGLAYLAHVAPQATYIATILVFGFGAIGVVLALRRGLNIACACMGNILRVPLSTVTLTEDALMVTMAAMLLLV